MNLFHQYLERYPEIVRQLLNAKRHHRLAHAFLIESDAAKTREEFTIVLSQIAGCPESGDGEPCTVCRVCRQLEERKYPETYTLSPVGKQYEIRIGDRRNPEPNTMRSFESEFHLSSTGEANVKFGIILDADRMNEESQNAFLKTLEEPPKATFFMLTTGKPSSLLPTTRSRCQSIRLPDNFHRFTFAGQSELFAALKTAFFDAGRNLATLESCAQKVLQVAASLSKDADQKTEENYQTKLTTASQVDPALVKRIEKQQESEAAGAYIKERQDFLSAIHTFFAQLYMLSQRVDFTDLPNPEVFKDLDIPAGIDADRALHALKEAENLLFTLRFNVNEELALRTFIMNLSYQEEILSL